MQVLRVSRSPRGLTAGALKGYAIAAMLLDHVAWSFVPTESPLGQVMHLIGRTTIPIMCFFLAEGYHHTRNFQRYALRLLLFAAISYLPFVYFETGGLPDAGSFFDLNVLYSLFVSLLALYAWEHAPNLPARILCLSLFCFLAEPGDWGAFAVLFTVAFGANRGSFPKQALWFSGAALLHYGRTVLRCLGSGTGVPLSEALTSQLFQLGVLLALPLLFLYNGEKGKGGKWFFYIFYPAHLLALGLLYDLLASYSIL